MKTLFWIILIAIITNAVSEIKPTVKINPTDQELTLIERKQLIDSYFKK